jgi:uncharacterized protein (DUF488 family)
MPRLVTQFPIFRDLYDGWSMRAFIQRLEQLFSQIVVDKRKSVSSISSDHTLTQDDTLMLVDTSAGNVTITLTAVQKWMIDERYEIEIKKMSAANRLRILPNAADTIDGYTIVDVLVLNTALALRATTDGWVIV